MPFIEIGKTTEGTFFFEGPFKTGTVIEGTAEGRLVSLHIFNGKNPDVMIARQGKQTGCENTESTRCLDAIVLDPGRIITYIPSQEAAILKQDGLQNNTLEKIYTRTLATLRQ